MTQLIAVEHLRPLFEEGGGFPLTEIQVIRRACDFVNCSDPVRNSSTTNPYSTGYLKGFRDLVVQVNEFWERAGSQYRQYRGMSNEAFRQEKLALRARLSQPIRQSWDPETEDKKELLRKGINFLFDFVDRTRILIKTTTRESKLAALVNFILLKKFDKEFNEMFVSKVRKFAYSEGFTAARKIFDQFFLTIPDQIVERLPKPVLFPPLIRDETRAPVQNAHRNDLPSDHHLPQQVSSPTPFASDLPNSSFYYSNQYHPSFTYDQNIQDPNLMFDHNMVPQHQQRDDHGQDGNPF